MSTKRALFLGGLLTVPALLPLGACEKYDTCENTLSCDEYGSGGNSASGGGDGDEGGTGGMLGGNGGQGGDMQDSCTACKGDTPACTAEKECVECTADNAEACTGTTDLCDDEKNECVECLGHADCDDETKPLCEGGTCVACDGNESCGELGNYCLSGGECVECLTEDDCGGNVCDPGTNSCTEFEAHALFVCEECVHDAQCQSGQLCVEQSFDSQVVGNFCTWTLEERVPSEDFCFPDGKPFIDDAAVTSTDGAEADVCVLRTTTCLAYLQHSKAVDGCDGTTSTDDAACGIADVEDGLCRQKAASFLCTYPCLSDDDCKTGATCSPESYCSL